MRISWKQWGLATLLLIASAFLLVVWSQTRTITQFRGGAAGTSAFSGPPPTPPLEVRRLELAGAAVHSAPVVLGETMVFVDELGAVRAVKLDSLSEQWIFEAADRVDSPLWALNSRIYFACRSGMVTCLDAETGEVCWTIVCSDCSPRILVCMGAEVITRTTYGTLRVYDAEDGRLRWQSEASSVGSLFPVAASGRLYWESASGVLHSSELESGQTHWTIDFAEHLHEYQSTGFNSNSAATQLGKSAAVDEGAVYLTAGERVVAVSTDSGRLLWTSNREFRRGHLLLASGRYICLVTAREFFRLRAGNAEKLGISDGERHEPRIITAAMSRGMLFVARDTLSGDSSEIECLELRSGDSRWREPVPPVAGGMIIIPGRILFVGRDGAIYVIESAS